MKKVRALWSFIKEAKAELKKVTWPTKKQIMYSTLIVITVITISAVYLGILDLIFSKISATFLR
ncbi:MAG: preprotein translocase subunit SecE [Synergistetes bacterium]|nr:preprotein translocase subunit SecE [Synergistota bacterium]